MNINNYNTNRYNKRKQWYRLILGIRQLKNYPLLNVIWFICAIGEVLLLKVKEAMIATVENSDILMPIYKYGLMIIVIILPILIAITIISGIGEMTARRDEADIYKVFGGNRELQFEAPILVNKKHIKGKGITIREFYTTIPMQLWRQKQETICDIFNVHLVSEIDYGGKCKSNGNRIVLKMAKGRRYERRDILYDDTFK